nr:MAG: wsv037-like protein [Metapenaeopsis lamellata majanivirus]
MEKFLSDSIQGVDILSSYRIKVCNNNPLMIIKDYTKTISGVSSELYLVRVGGPSSRERMVLCQDILDAFNDYSNSVSTVTPLSWQVFNDQSLHSYLLNHLQENNLYIKKYFSNNPLPGIGELVAFKYRGGIPQNLVFPIGSTKINWLCCSKSSKKMGEIFMKRPFQKNNIKEETLRRFRFWRYFYFIEDASERAGMLHHNPFTMSHLSFDINLTRTPPENEHDFSLSFIGDCFSRESIMLSDIVCGGKTSNFFPLLLAALESRIVNNTTANNRRVNENVNMDWKDIWQQNLTTNGYRIKNSADDETDVNDPLKRLKSAVLTSLSIPQEKKDAVLEFLNSVLTFSHREILSNLNVSLIAAKDEVEELLMIIASKLEWILLHSILQQIQFNILHLIGYRAHRILIFKLFIPILIAVIYTNGNISQTLLHAAANLKFIKKEAGEFTLANILNRSMICANPIGTTRYFSEYDSTDPEGLVSSASTIPLAVDVASALNNVSVDMEHINLMQQHVLSVMQTQKIVSCNQKKLENKKRKFTDKSKNKNQPVKKTKIINRENVGEGCSHWSDFTTPNDNNTNDNENDYNNNNESSTTVNDNIYDTNTKKQLTYRTLSNEMKAINLEKLQNNLSTKLRKKRGSNMIYSDNEMPSVVLQGIFNIIETSFGIHKGTIYRSVHANAREYLNNTTNHEPSRNLNLNNRVDIIERFSELIMDPPLFANKEKEVNIINMEKTLQNEQLLESLRLNPIFRAVEGAKDPLERMIVLWNIVKYINMMIVGLVSADLASLIDQRKGAKKALRRGTIMKQDEFNYREAGNAPGQVRDIIPFCISNLSCISGKNYRKQTCHHFFCRSCKLLFLNLDPDNATETFIDEASRATLLRLRDFCRDKNKISLEDWRDHIFDPIMRGKGWVPNGDLMDIRHPRDFSWRLKEMIINDELLASQETKFVIEDESNRMKPMGCFREPFSSYDDDDDDETDNRDLSPPPPPPPPPLLLPSSSSSSSVSSSPLYMIQEETHQSDDTCLINQPFNKNKDLLHKILDSIGNIEFDIDHQVSSNDYNRDKKTSKIKPRRTMDEMIPN